MTRPQWNPFKILRTWILMQVITSTYTYQHLTKIKTIVFLISYLVKQFNAYAIVLALPGPSVNNPLSYNEQKCHSKIDSNVIYRISQIFYLFKFKMSKTKAKKELNHITNKNVIIIT